MYYNAPIRRMVNYGQNETATFNPEDPIGFKAFYDSALKDIPYNRLLNLLVRMERNAPIWPNVSYNSGPGADFRAAGIDVAKSVPKDASEEQLMLVPYMLALMTYLYMEAVSKVTPSNVWKVKIQRYFNSEDVKTFLTYANPNLVVASPIGQGSPETAIGNISLASEELLELPEDKYDVVRPIAAFAQLLTQFLNEQKSSPFTDADLYPNLKTAAFNPLATPTTLPTVAPRQAQIQEAVLSASSARTMTAPTTVTPKPKANWPMLALVAAAIGLIILKTQKP